MLNSETVENIFRDCLFNEDEDTTKKVVADGITIKAGFHPERLETHRAEVTELLKELPNEFMASGGGGWSFLNACVDKDGNQWTDLQHIVELLLILGIAIGRAKIQLPREVWKALPGGVPYFIIFDKEDNDE